MNIGNRRSRGRRSLGVVPQDTKLTERSRGLPAWDSLNADQKRLYAQMMDYLLSAM